MAGRGDAAFGKRKTAAHRVVIPRWEAVWRRRWRRVVQRVKAQDSSSEGFLYSVIMTGFVHS